MKSDKFIAYLSDINPELINSYNIVKNNTEELIDLLKQHEVEYQKLPREYYYQLRNIIDSHPVFALQFIVLIHLNPLNEITESKKPSKVS